MKRVRIIFLLAVLVGAGVWAWRRWGEGREQVPETELTFYGNVDIRQVDLAFRVGGRLAEVFAEEGDALKPGDRVARLDPLPFEQTVALREAELARTQAELDKARKGSRDQEIKLAEAQLAESQAALKTLELQVDRTRTLVEQGLGAVSRQSFDDAVAARDAATARVAESKERLSLAVEGSRAEDIRAAEKARDAAAAQLALARTQVADTELFAPARGVVLSRVREPGSMVGIGETVVTLNKSDPVWVRAYLSEPQLGKIKPGMAARIFCDAFPDRPIEGRIGFISPEAEFTPKSVETTELRTQLVYRFRVIAQDPENRLRQGMPVTVKVDAEAAIGEPAHE